MAAPIPADTRAAAVRDYLAGQSSTDVGDRYDVSPSAVITWVRNAGHPIRTQAGGKPREQIAYTGGWTRRGLVMVPTKGRSAAPREALLKALLDERYGTDPTAERTTDDHLTCARRREMAAPAHDHPERKAT